MKLHNRMTESSLLVRILLEEPNQPFILLAGDEKPLQLVAQNFGNDQDFTERTRYGHSWPRNVIACRPMN
eukprot:5429521-Karenia_brevis.AAC.1